METETTTPQARYLILVAEDDESNFKLIEAILGKKYDIIWGRNGEEIVRAFEENRSKAAAILMDIRMPVMDGLEATGIIRAREPGIPIIMQTAYAFSTDKEGAFGAGATEVLVKPITPSILRSCLGKYFPDVMW